MRDLDRQLPLVYEELRRLARRYLSRERPDHTLQPTALVHEAYLRLREQYAVDFDNRSQFLAMAATMMRRVLVNYAEARGAAKRVAVVETGFGERDLLEVLALDRALTLLGELDARQMRVVELRCFAGLGVEETAEVMEISPATVKREWASAQLFIRRELTGVPR
jgi:RNA polymerase sigma factor (TIGR02999 family)